MSKPNVPIIDLQEASKDKGQLRLLDSACRDHGFFLLKNHGMQNEINNMWSMSEWFFAQQREDKLKLLRSEEIPLGFYDRAYKTKKRPKRSL